MNAETLETIEATILVLGMQISEIPAQRLGMHIPEIPAQRKFGLGMKIPEIPAQRKFDSTECHAHSNAHNQ